MKAKASGGWDLMPQTPISFRFDDKIKAIMKRKVDRLRLIKRLVAGLALSAVLVVTACAPPTRPYVVGPSVQDFAARDTCIASFLCKRIGGENNPSNEELNGFATSATVVCSGGVHQKMVQHAASYSNMQAMDDEITDEEVDTDHTEQYAFSVALDQKTSCARPTSPLE